MDRWTKHSKRLAKLKPKIVRLYPVLVIKKTELAKDFAKGEYHPITIEQAVERCKELYYFFDKKKITVIRMGLQNTDIISNPENINSEVVAGPYHEAFGQLVEDSIWYDKFVSNKKDKHKSCRSWNWSKPRKCEQRSRTQKKKHTKTKRFIWGRCKS